MYIAGRINSNIAMYNLCMDYSHDFLTVYSCVYTLMYKLKLQYSWVNNNFLKWP